jgi:hypothetical protein
MRSSSKRDGTRTDGAIERLPATGPKLMKRLIDSLARHRDELIQLLRDHGVTS